MSQEVNILCLFAAAAFFLGKAPDPSKVISTVQDGAGAVASPWLMGFNPLRFILAGLGIPVDHLVEGSRKCVNELGPEAVGAVKTLLVSGPHHHPGHHTGVIPPPRELGVLRWEPAWPWLWVAVESLSDQVVGQKLRNPA